MSAQDLDAGAALPKVARDYLPLLLPVALALAALPFIPSGSTWVTLTVAGLAMGMMIFVMASGLTLIFGLMDVLNFGHGAFIAIGAYMATLVLVPLAGWMQDDSVGVSAVGAVPSGGSPSWSRRLATASRGWSWACSWRALRSPASAA